MTTEQTNKVVVTLKLGQDKNAFVAEMTGTGTKSPYLPARAVAIANIKKSSNNNTDFIMTRAEMDLLKQDPRVHTCRWGTKNENGIFLKRMAYTGNRPYYRNTTFVANTDNNWGIPACNSNTNPFTGSSLLTYNRPYTLDGAGVDVVIMDTGIQADHPEWLNENGTASRLQQIDWYAATGQTGTMPVNFYTDDNGHGTQVASVVAGRIYGWAPGANIYVMNILGVNADSRWPGGTDDAINTIRLWHQNKPVNPLTGYKRPTIVNGSWGYSVQLSEVTFDGYNYRNGGNVSVAYSNTNASQLGNVGIVSQSSYNTAYDDLPTQVGSTDLEIIDAMAAGVIFVSAGGNDSYQQDISTGPNWNNYATYTYDSTNYTTYYHRGNTPGATAGMITIGAIEYNADIKAYFSKTGPGISLFSPGDYITGAVSTTNQLGPSGDGYPVDTYPLNTNYLNIKVSGTSQATPQVTGLIATILQARPYLNQATALATIQQMTTLNRITDTGGGYTDFYSLQGGGNRYLFNQFSGATVTVAQPGNATIYGSL